MRTTIGQTNKAIGLKCVEAVTKWLKKNETKVASQDQTNVSKRYQSIQFKRLTKSFDERGEMQQIKKK